MIYLSIDLETGGLDPLSHDILEFAAVIEDTERDIPLRELPRFRVGLKSGRDYYRLSLFAARMHTNLLSDMAFGVLPMIDESELGVKLRSWLKDNNYPDSDKANFKIVAAGKNLNGFDRHFLNKLPEFNRWINFHHRVLDPMPIYLRKDDKVPPDLNQCAIRAGINMANFELHTAVDDALLVIELIRRGLYFKGIK